MLVEVRVLDRDAGRRVRRCRRQGVDCMLGLGGDGKAWLLLLLLLSASMIHRLAGNQGQQTGPVGRMLADLADQLWDGVPVALAPRIVEQANVVGAFDGVGLEIVRRGGGRQGGL